MLRRKGKGWQGRRQPGQGWRQGRDESKPISASRAKAAAEFLAARKEADERVDAQFGFETFAAGEPRLGWLLNMLPTTVALDTPAGDRFGEGDGRGKSTEEAALELFFLQQDGSTFKAYVLHRPYFYLIVETRFIKEVKAFLERRYQELVDEIELVGKEDLDLGNHLSGLKRQCLKLSFKNVGDLMALRREILPIVEANKTRSAAAAAYEQNDDETAPEDLLECCLDMREYDVPYYTRVSIDLGINVGSYYVVKPKVWDGTGSKGFGVEVIKQDLVEKAEPRILAFDIECTKQPLKFPEAEFDQVFMISYMFDGQGYLIINREVVSEDIQDFEYTPKPEYQGPFEVFNEPDEQHTLRKFFEHCRELRPSIWVTYNGDFFDFPFIEARAKKYDMDMRNEIGVFGNKEGEYRGRCSVHMDCLYWVNRDSYLPAGSRGLKAVTKAKLGYDPVEVDPEDMVRFAQENPHHMAAYSVSDAVATFYLFEKYINLFVFSLCTIIPMGPEDVLRKGSGTLCEMLLMVEAYRGNIMCPNKQVDPDESFTDTGHLLEQETYIGGHVECLETGVYRNDIPERFRLDPGAFDELIANVDRDLTFAIEVENGIPRREVSNYDDVRDQIVESLELLRDTPTRLEIPTIYHLDVAAMYPNIILTNRLQPSAMVDETVCASCSFNTGPDASCKRQMDWMWRGEHFPCSKSDYNRLKTQIEFEKFQGKPYHELPNGQRKAELKKRLKTYCQTVYKRVKDTKVVEKQTTICQRENPFYVNTVRAFRDRRYDYKGLTKKWSKIMYSLEKKTDVNPIEVEEAKNKVLLFDSLQLAHKCILNSFYGYVMRKGARWHSMEMAGVVTHTGGNIIKQARKLVERVGRPLELDTDGIWCILPASFPENYAFTTSSGRTIPISYPCVMLNADVHAHFTNHQYQDLSGDRQYESHSECSIYFEVDGPYRCMVLPASQEEGKLLKKRYAVFNNDGSLAELKGFELKRRGELKIIKIFQSQVFEKFLQGNSLQTCYQAVAEIANFWLDVLYSKGQDLTDEEVIDLISENRSMSRNLEDYGEQKSTSITTAKRLAEFLGEELIKNKGLSCKLLIARQPYGAPTTERAIPTAIFSTDGHVKREFLCKWLKDNSITDFDVRSIIDWEYYIDRLGKAVQKIITIPAALQNVENPVPRVQHPDWLMRNVQEKLDVYKQRKLSSMFQKKSAPSQIGDMEDLISRPSREEQKDEEDEVDKTAIVAKDSASIPSAQKDTVSLEEVDDSTFPGWLENRKAKWKRLRFARKQKETNTSSKRWTNEDQSEGSMSRPDGKRGLLSYMNVSQSAGSAGYWQVLEVREQKTAGLFKLFVLSAKNEIQTVFIKAKRTFFVNVTRPETSELPEWISRVEVDWALPHRHPRHHLYRIEVDEDLYQENLKAWAEYCNRTEVVGVYELNVPGVSRLTTRIGCVARLFESVIKERSSSGTLRSGGRVDDPFRVSDIQQLVHTVNPYLEATSAQFRRLFVYQGGYGGRELVALFQVDDTSDWLSRAGLEVESEEMVAKFEGLSQEERELAESIHCSPQRVRVHLWVSLKRGGEKRKLNLPGMLSDTIDRVANRLEDAPSCQFESVSVQYERSIEECWRGLDQHLLHYGTQRKGPSFVILQVGSEKEAVLNKVTSLGDFPCVWMAPHKEERDLPALQWQQILGRRAVDRFLGHSLWFYNRIRCARYAHLPIAHVGEDFTLTMSDTFFIRHLRHNKQVIWATRGGIPDLGGFEEDSSHLDQLLESDSRVTVSSPGSYRSYCVELDILHLAVNTVLQATKVHEIEASGGSLALQDLVLDGIATNGGSQQIGTDGTVVRSKVPASAGVLGSAGECLAAFKVLRRMVQNWYSDLQSPDSEFADALLIHFYRWLCSPKSLLYDPALHKFIHQMMTKVFLQLLAEFRRLGAKVIHGNFQRVWICTGKNDFDSASAYCDHLIRTVRSKPLFEAIQMEPRKYWQGLLFMDEENYGGVLAPASVPEPPIIGYNDAVSVASDEDGGMEEDNLASKEDYRPVVPMRKRKSNESEENPASEENVDSDSDGNPALGTDRESDKVGARRSNTQNTLAMEEERVRRYKAGLEEENESGDEDNVDEDELRRYEASKQRRAPRRRKVTQHSEEEMEEEGYYDDDDGDGREEMQDFVVDDDDDKNTGENNEHGDFDVEVNWNISLYLPENLQEYFMWIIGEFLLEPIKFRNDWFQARQAHAIANKLSSQESAGDQEAGLASDLATIRVEEADLVEAEEEFLKSLVRQDLAQKLLHLIPKIVAAQGGAETFPKLPGSHLALHNPAVEFVKMVCTILEMDTKVKSEVTVVRRSLFRLIGVGEFDPETRFENPSLSLVVKDLICSFCNFCTDVDICRDPRFIQAGTRWQCPECDHPYDMDAVESSLVQRVQTLCMAFQLQDLSCIKCGQIRADNMSESCPCSGSWGLSISTSDQRANLRPFENASVHYGFEWLSDAVHSCQTVYLA